MSCKTCILHTSSSMASGGFFRFARQVRRFRRCSVRRKRRRDSSCRPWRATYGGTYGCPMVPMACWDWARNKTQGWSRYIQGDEWNYKSWRFMETIRQGAIKCYKPNDQEWDYKTGRWWWWWFSGISQHSWGEMKNCSIGLSHILFSEKKTNKWTSCMFQCKNLIIQLLLGSLHLASDLHVMASGPWDTKTIKKQLATMTDFLWFSLFWHLMNLMLPLLLNSADISRSIGNLYSEHSEQTLGWEVTYERNLRGQCFKLQVDRLHDQTQNSGYRIESDRQKNAQLHIINHNYTSYIIRIQGI